MSNFIKVSSVSEVKPDANKRPYKTVQFATPGYEWRKDGEETIKVKVKPRITSINISGQSYLDGKPEFGYDFEAGDSVEGDIVTRNVRPYKIPTGEGEAMREVSAYTTVVLGNPLSDNWASIVKSTFKSKGHDLIEEVPNVALASQRPVVPVEVF